jgi:CRISPR system Cascade subunit CasC
VTGTVRYLDIHVLQTVPYANLNRDDLGSPKTVAYGGAIRTRVSSQCWKRAVRVAVEERLGDPAVRTRRIALELAIALRHDGWPDELADFAGKQVAAAAAGGLALEPGGETSVLLYLPARALAQLQVLCAEHRDALAAGVGKPAGKKGDSVLATAHVNDIITSRNDIINLFGRMLAELPGSDVDGAVQVAHAFTTHVAEPEVDFFTAVDDWQHEQSRGSGHMNSAEFSAGVFYRYASVNLADLTRNLGGDTAGAAQLAGAFLDAFITSMPAAKKNSTAPFTVPDLVYIAARTDRPVSLAGAFEAPVRPPGDGGFAIRSRQNLNDYAGKVHKLLGGDGLRHHAHASTDEKALDALGSRVDSYRQIVDDALAAAEQNS